MRNITRTRLLSLMLSGMLALAPVPLLAAVYKCEHNGHMAYSDVPCAKIPQAVKSQVSVVPAFQPEDGSTRWKLSGLANSLGLDSTSGVIALLLFGAPLSIMLIFFLTRKSEK